MACGVLAVALLLLANSRTWVEGSVSDAVVQSARTSASGGKAAPAVLAATLVGAAAVLAAITTGRVARWIAAVIAVLAGVIAIVATIVVIRGPESTLRDSATSLTGHTGDQTVTASLTFWPWVGLLGGVLLLLTGLLTVLGARAWSGLSSRYDAPAARAAKTRSDWDLLSDGEDPTDLPSGSDTIDPPRPAG
nr:Trp biosynthesis-associated membrane protein [Flexivirga meconopsidis]